MRRVMCSREQDQKGWARGPSSNRPRRITATIGDYGLLPALRSDLYPRRGTFTVPILIGEAAALTVVKTARAIRESLRDLATVAANMVFLLGLGVTGRETDS